MRRLIAGCGFVGMALAKRWLDEGHEVFGLRRSPGEGVDGLQWIAADLAQPDDVARVPAGIDDVVYALSPGQRSDEAYERVFAVALGNLQAHLARTSPNLGRFAFVSSTGVYAQRDGSWVDEDSETEPDHFAGRRLLEGEELTLAGPGTGCVVRLGGIYGPGRTGLMERVRRGEATYAPGTPRYTNRIHRDDAAAILDHVIQLTSPPARLLGVDDCPAQDREVVEWLADQLGAPPPRGREPEPGSRASLSNRRCRNDRLHALGIQLAFPSYREGYATLLR